MSHNDPAVDPVLLDVLLHACEPVTIETLASRMSSSVDRVRRGVQALIDAECDLDDHPQQGIRLHRASLACWSDYFQWLAPGGLGRQTRVFHEIDSTQTLARQCVAAGADLHGQLFLADRQRAGRGRLGRTWLAPEGSSLLMTLGVRLDRGSDHVMLATSVAVAEAVESFGVPGVRIRWPNDVMVLDAKLAGILVEVVGTWALIGIGVNVGMDVDRLPTSVDGRVLQATSLAMQGVRVDRLRVGRVLLERLSFWLECHDDAALREAWRRRSSLLQNAVEVSVAGRLISGRVIDVNADGALLLQTDDGAIVPCPGATTTLLSPR